MPLQAAAARGHVTLRVTFLATLSQDTSSTPLPLSGLAHVVDEGSSDYVLNRGSSIPQSAAKGKVTQIPHADGRWKNIPLQTTQFPDPLRTSPRDVVSGSRSGLQLRA